MKNSYSDEELIEFALNNDYCDEDFNAAYDKHFDSQSLVPFSSVYELSDGQREDIIRMMNA